MNDICGYCFSDNILSFFIAASTKCISEVYILNWINWEHGDGRGFEECDNVVWGVSVMIFY